MSAKKQKQEEKRAWKKRKFMQHEHDMFMDMYTDMDMDMDMNVVFTSNWLCIHRFVKFISLQYRKNIVWLNVSFKNSKLWLH